MDVDAVAAITEKELLGALNGILEMRDFHSKIATEQYESLISKEIQQLLIRAQEYDPNLTDKDYLKLNRALLEAIYPQEIKRSIQDKESFVKSYKAVQRWFYDRGSDRVNFWSTIIYNVGEDIVKFAANNSVDLSVEEKNSKKANHSDISKGVINQYMGDKNKKEARSDE